MSLTENQKNLSSIDQPGLLVRRYRFQRISLIVIGNINVVLERVNSARNVE